ncbi:MAG TPA: alpha/beta fold hydrolase [Holophagaceae bacterium]|nr:alpha/beta fold hydrolase [Holophagaceae bacterium]
MTLRLLLRSVLLLLALYGGLCAVVFALQRRLQYFPDRSSEAGALRRAAASGLVAWRDPGGHLLGWRRPGPAQAAARLLVFHGNAGNALDRLYYVRLFEALGVDVVLMEYPGYGARAGAPSEAALVAAGAEAAALLAAEGPLFLLGESLGSGVALQVAGAAPTRVRGVLLVTPYARMSDVGAEAYPWLPVRWLLRDRWDNLAALPRYPGPVAILLAGQDEVVGAAQGRKLAAEARGPVQVWEQPKAGHNTLTLAPREGHWADLWAFVRTGS